MPSASFPFTVTFLGWPEGLGGQEGRGLGETGGMGGECRRVAEMGRDGDSREREMGRETGREGQRGTHRGVEISRKNIDQEIARETPKGGTEGKEKKAAGREMKRDRPRSGEKETQRERVRSSQSQGVCC